MKHLPLELLIYKKNPQFPGVKAYYRFDFNYEFERGFCFGVIKTKLHIPDKHNIKKILESNSQFGLGFRCERKIFGTNSIKFIDRAFNKAYKYWKAGEKLEYNPIYKQEKNVSDSLNSSTEEMPLIQKTESLKTLDFFQTDEIYEGSLKSFAEEGQNLKFEEHLDESDLQKFQGTFPPNAQEGETASLNVSEQYRKQTEGIKTPISSRTPSEEELQALIEKTDSQETITEDSLNRSNKSSISLIYNNDSRIDFEFVRNLIDGLESELPTRNTNKVDFGSVPSITQIYLNEFEERINNNLNAFEEGINNKRVESCESIGEKSCY